MIRVPQAAVNPIRATLPSQLGKCFLSPTHNAVFQTIGEGHIGLTLYMYCTVLFIKTLTQGDVELDVYFVSQSTGCIYLRSRPLLVVFLAFYAVFARIFNPDGP